MNDNRKIIYMVVREVAYMGSDPMSIHATEAGADAAVLKYKQAKLIGRYEVVEMELQE